MGAVGTQTVDTTARIAALRELMKKENVDVWVVPSEDQRMLFHIEAEDDTERSI